MRDVRGLGRVCLAALLVITVGCSETSSKSPAVGERTPQSTGSFSARGMGPASQHTERRQSETTRHVAVRQFLALEVDAEQVEPVLRDAVARCAAPQCEVLESALARDSRGAPPRAQLRLRIAPAASGAYLDELARRGDVIERRTESEDKTEQVIDVEARLRNTAELRDRLRKLLAAHGATVKDLVEVEAQLARVQTELDAASGRRKALADETEKVTLTADIRSRRSVAEAGAMEPIREALNRVGHTFARSLAGLIGFVVAAVPWLVLAVPAIWLWRRWRRARRTP